MRQRFCSSWGGGLVGIRKKIGGGGFALDHDGMALPFPADGVGDFAGRTILLGKYDRAAIFMAQPIHSSGDQLTVSERGRFAHGSVVTAIAAAEKWQIGVVKKLISRQSASWGVATRATEGKAVLPSQKGLLILKVPTRAKSR
jgi:hypothetical protein